MRLTFSDGTTGVWNAGAMLAGKGTSLTIPLRDRHEFARAFIDNGALAWPNRLELAPWTLHQEMEAAGLLSQEAT
ncbi:hypothetical protein [Blastomonas sp.]|uniref:hypothetical protein n=1 Tax=Blastomonas sp. TaxID=1909299 RepID=UPI00391B64C7